MILGGNIYAMTYTIYFYCESSVTREHVLNNILSIAYKLDFVNV